jgi:tetratricopeptide (TPR) repeat protein
MRRSRRLRAGIGALALLALAAVAVFAAASGAPAEPTAALVAARQAYEAGEPAQAIELYRELLERGLGGGHLFYDLGNAYLRNGELGRAIASYLRAERLLPRDEDVRANLAFARRSSKDALAPPTPSPVAVTLFFWHYGLSPAELALAAVLASTLFFSCLAARLRWPGSELLRWVAVALLLPLLASVGSLAARALAPSRVAVILPPEVGAAMAPAADGVIRFELHAGTEVAVRDRQGDWLRVALPSGEQGWIHADWAEVVE